MNGVVRMQVVGSTGLGGKSKSAADVIRVAVSVNHRFDLISLARELGVRMIACEMSRDLMGIQESELVAGLECGGVASFLADSLKSQTSLFI